MNLIDRPDSWKPAKYYDRSCNLLLRAFFPLSGFFPCRKVAARSVRRLPRLILDHLKLLPGRKRLPLIDSTDFTANYLISDTRTVATTCRFAESKAIYSERGMKNARAIFQLEILPVSRFPFVHTCVRKIASRNETRYRLIIAGIAASFVIASTVNLEILDRSRGIFSLYLHLVDIQLAKPLPPLCHPFTQPDVPRTGAKRRLASRCDPILPVLRVLSVAVRNCDRRPPH